MVREVEQILASEENVDVFVAESGVGGAGGFGGAQSSGNVAKITVDFLPDRNNATSGQQVRVEPTPLTIDHIRERVAEIPGAVITCDPESMGPPVGADIAVKVSGAEFHEVGAIAQRVKRAVAKIDGVTDMEDDYRVGRPELALRVDRAAAKRIGVSTGQIGSVVRTAIAGTAATTIRNGDEEWNVVVRLAPQYRNDLQQVLGLRLPGREDTSPKTFPVPLSAVASYDLAGGTGSIRHIDQDLVVTIEGDVLDGYNVNAVQGDVRELLGELDLPEGVYATLSGSTDEQDEAAAFLGRAFAIAIALILLVLVTQFDSLTHPLIILASVVLSLIGVLWGLLLVGQPFGVMMTGIGLISLAGVVVNNAIVLLDYVEQLRSRGFNVHDALVTAGLHRFRPVMLTAVTTVLGLVPMATGISFDFRAFKPIIGGQSAQWWGAMAWAVIFGLTFATMLTLVMVPTMYSMFDDLGRWRSMLWDKLRGKAPASTTTTTTAAVLLLALLPATADAAPVTLDQAWRAAEEQSVDLGIISQNTLSAESLRGQAWSALSPQVVANGAYNINELEIVLDTTAMIPEEFADLAGDAGEPIVIQQKEYISASLTIQQTLFSGTALPALKGAYKLTHAAREDEAMQRQRIHAGVTRAHYGLATARQGALLAALSVENANHQLELAERQVAAGLQAERARLQAQLAVSRAEREARAAREQEVAAEEAYVRMTGLPRDSDPVLPEAPAAPADLTAALAKADDRPDVAAAEYRARAAELQRNASWWSWAPRVTAQWTYNYSENTGFADDPTFWVASINGTWSLWDGGLRIAQAKDNAAKARIANLQVESARRAATEEIRNAHERYTRADSAVSAVEREAELAKENLRLAERSYEAGSATWLEVETARLGLEQTELNRLVERMNRDMAAADLLVAVGEG